MAALSQIVLTVSAESCVSLGKYAVICESIVLCPLIPVSNFKLKALRLRQRMFRDLKLVDGACFLPLRALRIARNWWHPHF